LPDACTWTLDKFAADEDERNMSRMPKRIAVITGAARAIGRRVAEVLAERGYGLLLIDLDIPEETVESVRAP